MAKTTGKKGVTSLFQQAATSLANALRRKRKTKTATKGQARKSSTTAANGSGGAAKQTRRPRREADIPLEQLANTYTPTQTSLKAPFRASGADRQRDQDFAGGFSDDRWNDEDHFTNKSGDPRIGTHGRTYEPGETKE